MGSCVSIRGITINLHQNNLVYFTDERISGIVNWSNEHKIVETDEVYIMLVGEIGFVTCTTKVNPADGSIKAVNKSYHVQFYSSKISLAQAQSESELLAFRQGQYSWPFEFSLPDHLPPSIYPPNIYPHVRYYLQAFIEPPWGKPKEKDLRFLTIYPRVNLLENSQWLQQTIFGNQNRKQVSLTGIINKIGFIPGELIEFTIEINNPRQVSIRHIDLFIFQSFKYGEISYKKEIFRTTVPNIQDTNCRQIEETFSVSTSNLSLPPTYEFLCTFPKIPTISNQYFIKFTADVQGIGADFDIKIPIIIATEPKSHNCQDLFTLDIEDIYLRLET